jgi:hypothetical protein
MISEELRSQSVMEGDHYYVPPSWSGGGRKVYNPVLSQSQYKWYTGIHQSNLNSSVQLASYTIKIDHFLDL